MDLLLLDVDVDACIVTVLLAFIIPIVHAFAMARIHGLTMVVIVTSSESRVLLATNKTAQSHPNSYIKKRPT